MPIPHRLEPWKRMARRPLAVPSEDRRTVVRAVVEGKEQIGVPTVITRIKLHGGLELRDRLLDAPDLDEQQPEFVVLLRGLVHGGRAHRILPLRCASPKARVNAGPSTNRRTLSPSTACQ